MNDELLQQDMNSEEKMPRPCSFGNFLNILNDAQWAIKETPGRGKSKWVLREEVSSLENDSELCIYATTG
jgi:hypothetical protein